MHARKQGSEEERKGVLRQETFCLASPRWQWSVSKESKSFTPPHNELTSCHYLLGAKNLTNRVTQHKRRKRN